MDSREEASFVELLLMEAKQDNKDFSLSEQELNELISELIEKDQMESGETDGARKSARASDPLFTVGKEGDDQADVFLEEEGLKAFMLIRQGQDNLSGKITEEMIWATLEAHRISYGINRSQLIRLIKNPVYGERFCFAEGDAPVAGKDGRIELRFELERKIIPKEDEKTGAVNFKELEFGNVVKKGDILAEIIMAEEGCAGCSVTGDVIPYQCGKEAMLPLGASAVVSEDQRHIVAACDGEVAWRKEKIWVDRMMTLKEVDGSTGNINFLGSVRVEGNVWPGFSVRATGNILVKGIVDSAALHSGGEIAVSGGVNGSFEKGIYAEESVRSKYIENAVIKSRKSIYADTILNSEIECGEQVIAEGRRGSLMGGFCRAMRVKARQVGNAANVKTVIQIDYPDWIEQEQKSIDEKISELTKATENEETPVEKNENEIRMDQYRTVWGMRAAEERQKKLDAETAELKERIEMGVFVQLELHPNVIVSIEGQYLQNNDLRKMCSVIKRDGEITMNALLYFG